MLEWLHRDHNRVINQICESIKNGFHWFFYFVTNFIFFTALIILFFDFDRINVFYALFILQ